MKEKITIFLFILFFSCTLNKRYTVSRGILEEEIDKIAKEFTKKLPENKTLVVCNILKEGKFETYNSVNLAIKIGNSLAEKGRNKFKVIDRSTGELLVWEERKYTVKELSSSEWIKFLENFKADIGITGEYNLIGETLILENIRAIMIPSPLKGPEIIASSRKSIIPLTPIEAKIFHQNERPLPQLPDTITEYFLTASTDSNFFSANLVDLQGKTIENNICKIGSFYRLKINLEKDAFLYVFSYDEDNNISYLLYPLNPNQNNIIRKGNIFIPPQNTYALKAKPPAGKNFIKIFATKNPLSFKFPKAEDMHLTKEELKNFVKELKKLPLSDWSSKRIFIIVE